MYCQWLDKFGDRAFIINGDKPIVRKTDEGIFVFGTPWCGKEGFNENIRVKLKSICILERAALEMYSLQRVQKRMSCLLVLKVRI